MRLNRIMRITIIVVGAMCTVLQLSEAYAQSLDSLVRRAVAVHPSVQSSELAIKQAEARSRSARAWEAPRVGVEFSMLPPSNPNPFAEGETMFLAEQTVPLFGQNVAMADAALAQRDVARAELARVQRTLKNRVEKEYYTLWLLHKRAVLTADNLKHADVLYKAAETRYIAGNTPQSSLLRMSIDIESFALEQNIIAEETREATARMNVLLARQLDTPIIVDDSIAFTELPLFDSSSARIVQHPSLTKMDASAAAMSAEAVAQATMLKPMLMLRAGVTYMPLGHPVREGNLAAMTGEIQMNGAANVTHFGLSAGAMISVPIAPWSRSGPDELIQAYQLESAQMLNDKESMRRDMIAMLRSEYANANRAVLRMKFYRTIQIPLIERTLESTVSDYANSRTTFSAVVDVYHLRALAYMDLYMRQTEYAMALSMITELTGDPK